MLFRPRELKCRYLCSQELKCRCFSVRFAQRNVCVLLDLTLKAVQHVGDSDSRTVTPSPPAPPFLFARVPGSGLIIAGQG